MKLLLDKVILRKAKRLLKINGAISTAFLQRKFKITYALALLIMGKLI